MQIIIAIIFELSMLSCCFSAPSVARTTIEVDPELTAGYFEGDIVLDTTTRNVMRNVRRRWPNNTVPYYINKEYFTAEHINYIQKAMHLIESVSCVHFREANPKTEIAYVNITGKDDGCYSNIGYWNQTQKFNVKVSPINTGCFKLFKIVHELMHTLGFYHQHSSPNRDEYVHIAEENIEDDKIGYFGKLPDWVATDLDVEYDYASILHYNPYAFSKNGERTIVALRAGGEVMGQREYLPQSDINKINKMYPCNWLSVWKYFK